MCVEELRQPLPPHSKNIATAVWFHRLLDLWSVWSKMFKFLGTFRPCRKWNYWFSDILIYGNLLIHRDRTLLNSQQPSNPLVCFCYLSFTTCIFLFSPVVFLFDTIIFRRFGIHPNKFLLICTCWYLLVLVGTDIRDVLMGGVGGVSLPQCPRNGKKLVIKQIL